jgi:phage shock protein C
MIAGVAGGLAEYFGVDVILVRLLWVLVFFMGGGFLIYLIAWLIIPENPYVNEVNPEESTKTEQEQKDQKEDEENRWRLGGICLIAAGLIFILRELLPWSLFNRNLIPIFLIILGLFILIRSFGRD